MKRFDDNVATAEGEAIENHTPNDSPRVGDVRGPGHFGPLGPIRVDVD